MIVIGAPKKAQAEEPGRKVHRNGYFVGRDHFYTPDTRLPKEIAFFLLDEKAQTVADFGCGKGEYVEKLRGYGIRATGYDGNPDTPELTKGLGKTIDLTQKVELGEVFDFVLCLDVGQFIPEKKIPDFIENIHRHNSKGVIISWPDTQETKDSPQGSVRIKNVFHNLGYVSDEKGEKLLREKVFNAKHLANCIMVFKKLEVPPCFVLVLPESVNKARVEGIFEKNLFFKPVYFDGVLLENESVLLKILREDLGRPDLQDKGRELYKWALKSQRGEVGCYLAHLRIYKHMEENKIERAVIFEERMDVEDLRPVAFHKPDPNFCIEFLHVHEGFCTVAYSITLEGARILLQDLDRRIELPTGFSTTRKGWERPEVRRGFASIDTIMFASFIPELRWKYGPKIVKRTGGFWGYSARIDINNGKLDSHKIGYVSKEQAEVNLYKEKGWIKKR